MDEDSIPISLAKSGVSRRDFMRRSLFGATGSATLPGFLGHSFFGLDAFADSTPPAGDEGPLVIVIQQAGGNDSLNTVIPYDVSAPEGSKSATAIYYEERPTLAIPPEVVLPLQEGYGLHPTLLGFKQAWDEAELAVINGVGYPNPNLSHFSSFDFWHTGRPDVPLTDGWLGRFFDHACAGVGEVPIHLGVGLTPSPIRALHSSANRSGVSFQEPDSFQWLATQAGADRRSVTFFQDAIDPRSSSNPANDTLTYVQRTTHDALISSGQLQLARSRATGFPHTFFPRTDLGSALFSIAELIAGGAKTQVYYADHGGYDTHFSQIVNDDPLDFDGAHYRLLSQFNSAISAFRREMIALGVWDRVLILTFSEFGRKVIQNGTGGSDHGAAESLFVMGGAVKGGFYGTMPSLLPEDRIASNSMAYHVDFRRVYRSVLQNWLAVPEANIADILPAAPADGNFETIPFV